MKKLLYLFGLPLLAVAAMSVASCEDDSEPSKANKGKEKPVVSVEIADSTTTEFVLRIKGSEGTKYVGYAVYSGGKATAPSAYEILTQDISGTVATHVYESGSAEFTDTVMCVVNDNYQVFAAAMTESGLIGDVTELPLTIVGAHPAVSLVLGDYDISPSEEAVADFDATYSARTSQPMTITLSKVSDTQYVASGYWFNLFGLDFVGTYDYSTNRLSFDGTMWDSQTGAVDPDGSYFGYVLGYIDSSIPTGWALFGAGSSGTLPMIFQCEVSGTDSVPVSVVQGIDFRLYNGSSGSWVRQSHIAYFAGGEVITPAESE